jgi:nucleoside 2-deoxyribosyltransferase
MQTNSYSIYLAGELFSLKHLTGNAILADEIEKCSGGSYQCVVPQDKEQRETTPLQIRNQDLHLVVSCDVGVFHFDGPELDSGTVVEYMLAKMLDIPSVIVRSDFRAGGDSSDPWNLMLSGFPRTEVIILDAMRLYQKGATTGGLTRTEAALASQSEMAELIVSALDSARNTPPLLTREEQTAVYGWFRRLPASEFDQQLSEKELFEILESKRARGLL